MERWRGRMNGGCQGLQNCGDEKIHSDGERGRDRGSRTDTQFDGRLIPSLSFDNTGSLGAESGITARLWLLKRSARSFSSQRKNGIYLKYSEAQEASPPPPSFFPLPPAGSARSPPPLPVGKEKVGGEWVGEEGPPAAGSTVGVSFLRLLPAYGGQDAIGSALRVIWCLSLSNSEQGRQEATPPGSCELADGLKRAPSSEGGRRGRGGEKGSSLSLTYCTIRSKA